jgi:VanZ family protein
MKYFAVFFTLFIIGIIVLADMGRLPWFISMFYRFPYGDKAGHFILFGLLNFFITRAALSSPRFQNRKLVALSVGLVLALFMAAEEWSQHYFSTRTVSIADLLAGYLGIFLGALIALRTRTNPPRN